MSARQKLTFLSDGGVFFIGARYGMEMDSYKSQILDGVLMVLVQKQNPTCPCLKLHASVSQIFWY
jgi:hypothetical protein